MVYFTAATMFNSVLNRVFLRTSKEFDLPLPGPVHGPRLPKEDEEEAVRVVLCHDGVLAESVIPHMYRGNRLTPEPAHAEPPLLYRNFGQQGMSLSNLANSEGEFAAFRRMWANFGPRITMLALGGHDLQRKEIVLSPHRSYDKQVKIFFFF
ncbi:unnamed protein product, partial [Meganyctiphanes norvegica]